MVTITIIGWYGTETIGDRAILAGLIRVFSEIYNEYTINLGSIIPHFTERILIEDNDFYLEISARKLQRIKIFDSMNSSHLKSNIKQSDILAIGGGPLMDLQCMYMLEYAFKYAKKHNIKTCILGCGWGPLKINKYIKTAINIIKNADLVIFRDSDSASTYTKYGTREDIHSLIDPAFFTAKYFIDKYPCSNISNYIAINFRDLFIDNQYDSSSFKISRLSDIIKQIVNKYPDKQIKLIPMHTFNVGGDDRIILEKVRNNINSKQVSVCHEPLSLKKTMEIYRDAQLCVGMRFHSIVLQTIVNGYNYILDYTDPSKGKIIGMLRQLGLEEQFKNRYTTISKVEQFIVTTDISKININQEQLAKYFNSYTQLIKNILS